MNIAIIGTGYAGLVSGTCLAEAGHTVIGMDISQEKIDKLRQGISPIYEPGLQEMIQQNARAGRLSFTSSLDDIDDPDAIFFALPTPSGGDGDADLSYILSAAKDVAKVIKTYTVLVDKSTVPVGTTQKVREVVAAETDVPFDVVSNPEFLREGYAVEDFLQADRIVVGSSSERALAVMEEIYQPLTHAGVPLLKMDEASAEMSKYAANSFLVTKITFMNEIANMCEVTGANVDRVREAIGADQRIGSRFLFAGIGYGGGCFPKDVLALYRSGTQRDYEFQILSAVMKVNNLQKKILVQKVVSELGEDLSGKTFALWGLAFKPNTDDIRDAPALDIIRDLLARGATVQAYDPEAMDNVRQVFPTEITYAASAHKALEGADALLIATEWNEFVATEPALLANTLKAKMVFDGRNIFDPATMQKAGLGYFSIGRTDHPSN